jgi:hypothetical protein
LTLLGNTSNTIISVDGTGNAVMNGQAIATVDYIQTYVDAQEAPYILANVVTLLANVSDYVVGMSYGYATDGRKPSEFDPGHIANVSINPSGVPVFFGYADYANVVANAPTWLSSLDGYQVQS